MSNENKNLSETIASAVKETQDTSTQETTETKKELAQQDTTGETNTGETPEYVSGIDISKYPERERPLVRKVLEDKAGLLEKGYHSKFEEVAKFKKAQDELVKLGLDVDEARDVLVKHIEQKRNPTQTTQQKKEAVKKLDKLIENAPDEQKQPLEQMRQIILEETEVVELKKQVQDLHTLVKELSGDAVISKRSKVEQYAETLTPKYGKELIDKYRDNFVDAHINYKIPLEKLIQSVIPLEELEQAILSKGRKPLTQEKKEAISSTNSGVTSTSEKIDIKSKDLKGLILDVVSKKR